MAPLNVHSSDFRRTLLMIVVLLVLTPFLAEPKIKLISSEEQRLERYAFLTSYEWEAAQWISLNTPNNALLISDPTTMFILDGLTYRVIPFKRMWVIPEEYDKVSVETLKNIKEEVFRNRDPASIHSFVSNLAQKDQEVYIIYSGRTNSFKYTDMLFVLEVSSDTVPEPVSLLPFLNTWWFEKVYNNTGAYIFKVVNRKNQTNLPSYVEPQTGPLGPLGNLFW